MENNAARNKLIELRLKDFTENIKLSSEVFFMSIDPEK
jgi:hypothetical protein